MSFNRNSYDNKAYLLKSNSNSNFSNYHLFGSYAENNKQCNNYCNLYVDNNSVSTTKEPYDLSYKNIIDTESKLSWRNNKLSKHNERKKINDIKMFEKKDCECVNYQDTRFTHPLENYREMNTLNYNYTPILHVNPLNKIQQINEKLGLNSRLFTKDTYRQ